MTLRRRWILWLLVLPANAVLLVLLGTLFAVGLLLALPGIDDGSAPNWVDASGDLLGEGEYWAWVLPLAGVITLSQAVFLLPVIRLRPPRGERGRSLTASIVAAGLASIVTLALALGLMELAGQLAGGAIGDQDPWQGEELLGQPWAAPVGLVLLAGSWVGWTMLVLVFGRARWADTLLGRLAACLLGGTLVELLIVLPIDQMVRRRTDCYCAAGTFWSILGSVVALLWLTGPGIVFAITSRRRRLMRETHCARCGYAKGPTPGPVCPECQYQWRGPEA